MLCSYPICSCIATLLYFSVCFQKYTHKFVHDSFHKLTFHYFKNILLKYFVFRENNKTNAIILLSLFAKIVLRNKAS